MFQLFYLDDQTAQSEGGINGAATLKGDFSSLAAAQAQAASDGIAHFSVEQLIDGSSDEWQVVWCV